MSLICSARSLLPTRQQALPLACTARYKTRVVRCKVYRPSSDEENAGCDGHNPYELAGERLQTLLAGVRHRNDTLLDEVEGYTPDQRVTLLANLGCAVVVVSFVSCFLGQEDPLGGITLTQSSLEAAAWGLAYGLPLLACSAAGHSQPAKRAFPVLAELHNAQRELVGPMTAGMSLGQLGVLFGFVVLPCLLLLLPGFKGAWNALEGFLTAALLSPKALLSAAAPPAATAAATAAVAVPHVPHAFKQLVPSVLSSYTAGFVVASCLGVRRTEIAAIRDALKSAERYFRLSIAQGRGKSGPLDLTIDATATADTTSSGSSSSGGGSSLESSQELTGVAPAASLPDAAARFHANARSSDAMASAGGATSVATGTSTVKAGGIGAAAQQSSEARSRSAAQAFRLVACVWLLERFQVSRLGFVLASLNVCYLYIIWLATYDLMTPAAAALLHCAAEWWFSAAEQRGVEEGRRGRLQQQRRGSAGDEGGGDD